MVTVELALAGLLLSMVALLVVTAGGAVARLAQCQLTANEVARQEARGDREGVARASADAPVGARVETRHEAGATVVVVSLEVEVGPARVPLSASARVLDEGA